MGESNSKRRTAIILCGIAVSAVLRVSVLQSRFQDNKIGVVNAFGHEVVLDGGLMAVATPRTIITKPVNVSALNTTMPVPSFAADAPSTLSSLTHNLEMTFDDSSHNTVVTRSALEVLDRRTYQSRGNLSDAIIHEAWLQSGVNLSANKANVDFHANLSVSASGKACFHFTIQDVATICPFPYIQVRLSGVALVHVPLSKSQAAIRNTNPALNASELQGCAQLPVSGDYYVDAHLIHCRMNAAKEGMTAAEFKEEASLPVIPAFSKMYAQHLFHLPSVRYQGDVPPKLNAYPGHAWVFAPLCPGSAHRVGCHQGQPGKFISTKVQDREWLKHNPFSNFFKLRVHVRYDGFMWLPVSTDGVVDYKAEHFSYYYTPPPSFLSAKQPEHNQTMLFVGASHSRYLMNQVSQIYYNITNGKDGCVEDHTPPPDLDHNVSRFEKFLLRMANTLEDKAHQGLLQDVGNHFDKYVIVTGHWDAGYPFKKPTPPDQFLKSVLKLLEILEEFAKPGAKIFVMTVNQHPMGKSVLSGLDWRLPPLINTYNEQLFSQVEVDFPIDSTLSFRFKGFNRSYLLDNTDIMDPIWDSATDFYHPCRYGVRPMALRVLDLLKL